MQDPPPQPSSAASQPSPAVPQTPPDSLPPPSGARAAAAASAAPASVVPAAKPPARLILRVLVVIVTLAVLYNLFAHRENRYEKLAQHVTESMQRNDIAAVQSEANAESRLHINRQVVGHGADVLAPLGKIKSVKETTPAGETDKHKHTFLVTFEHATVAENFQLDADEKIFAFHYDAPIKK